MRGGKAIARPSLSQVELEAANAVGRSLDMLNLCKPSKFRLKDGATDVPALRAQRLFLLRPSFLKTAIKFHFAELDRSPRR